MFSGKIWIDFFGLDVSERFWAEKNQLLNRQFRNRLCATDDYIFGATKRAMASLLLMMPLTSRCFCFVLSRMHCLSVREDEIFGNARTAH
jgi:hypothetical protein